jgi:flagellar basal body-associated protein FliL
MLSVPYQHLFFNLQIDAKTERKNTLLHSAWVIIAIVLTIVFGAVAVYYWVLFYPILCKKERKYDVMQMSAKP